ncbi:MAG TPA: hypothetical protein VGP67_01435 [Gaiellales bacterium]|nr:hypothetical protein [Gaiellales bacterium]
MVRRTGRPVMLIHGWQGDHRYMQADVDAVFEAAGGWRRLYLDLPGHGQTRAPMPWPATKRPGRGCPGSASDIRDWIDRMAIDADSSDAADGVP